VTSIGFRTRRHADPAAARLPDAAESSVRAALAAPTGWVRVGTIELRSAARYLVVWALVLFGVLGLVLAGGYVALAVLGVTRSMSRALAIILDEPLPESGVLPALQPQRVVPTALLVSAVLSALSLVSGLAAVLVHNAVSALTGGVRVRVRPEGRTPIRPLRDAPLG
jgi:hypothetical protein